MSGRLRKQLNKVNQVIIAVKNKLVKRIEEASSRPRYEHLPARIAANRPSPIDCQDPAQNSDKTSHHQSLIDLESPHKVPVMSANGYPCPMPSAFVYPGPMMMPAFDQMKPTPQSLVNLAASEADMNKIEGLGSQYGPGGCWQPQQSQIYAPIQAVVPTVTAPRPESSKEAPVVLNSQPVQNPCCQAIFDYESPNPEDLDFKEGAIIELLSRIDENWFEGLHNGRSGLFPSTYVQVLVPLH